ncbi:TetR family transcriptional regulator [Mycobacterium sp. CBMA 234]|uniref:TetR/AcrR family transcriptional regulator n=1 Tax=Mycolicibacterium sp. CBMA 234 TaxID=1918495 RepID=UPI0012DFA9BC|nr:TetR/AcrR family transcriptional regulator [Mycolicibacterium sp. CBMA 234]MUL63573.1 TetR family transcriptional regulator [Mycolicibacterium sp. CBMA 234]
MSPVDEKADGVQQQSRQDRILNAALNVFAQRGTSDATLQMVADSAGVSVGLVQHHFGTKDGLIKAVDDAALKLITATMIAALESRGPDSVAAIGRAVHELLTDHLVVMDYLGRAVASESPSGTAIFDAMAHGRIERWQRMVDNGDAADGLDPVWAGLNPLVLTLGAIILRRHLDRHLPATFTSDAQLTRWEDSVNALIRHGQLRP